MAPGANQLVVGGDGCNNGDFGNQGLFDADIVTIDGTDGGHHPLANISSNSWGPGDDTQPAILTNIMHAYLVRAAAQGVGMYFASGDSSGVETPDDPFTILVGGTSLGIGKNNRRLFETGWSSGLSILNKRQWLAPFENGATSGGPSLIWAQPAYQHGVVPRALATAPGNRGGPGPVRARHRRRRRPVHRVRHRAAVLPEEQAAEVPPDHGRRDQHGLAAGGRHRSPTPSRGSAPCSGSPTRCSTG